jgi:5-methylcytosine-specific restriction endonuclease McrA
VSEEVAGVTLKTARYILVDHFWIGEERMDGSGEYPENWSEIAYEVKTEAGWRCEQCGREHDPGHGYCLTVHHLNGDKGDCRRENLVALCQRCHLSVQAHYAPGQEFLPGLKPAWAEVRGL